MKNSQGLKTTPEKEILKQLISVLETIALEVSQSLDLDNVLQSAPEKTIQVMELDAGGIL
jgi:hypothetical protein